MSLQPLDKKLRKQLETTIIKASNVAETAARTALKRLCVEDNKPGDHLTDEIRHQRNKLRAHGRQIGGVLQDNAEQSIEHLAQETAYEQWHRMLFSRFLAGNYLLIDEDGETSVAGQVATAETVSLLVHTVSIFVTTQHDSAWSVAY